MSRAVGVQCAGSSVPSAIPLTGDERSAGCPNGISNLQNASGSGSLQGNMQNISDRLQTLHDLYENRNQVNDSSCLETRSFRTLVMSIVRVFILNAASGIGLYLRPVVKNLLSWSQSVDFCAQGQD
jgi:hypothetical protein